MIFFAMQRMPSSGVGLVLRETCKQLRRDYHRQWLAVPSVNRSSGRVKSTFLLPEILAAKSNLTA
jgi:hypothetical protein